jgi:tungstate transport system ATP-binding protein
MAHTLPNPPVLEVRDLLIRRNGKEVLKLNHFAVNKGETLAVIGPNGSGKSTLLLALARILKIAQGEVYFQGSILNDRDLLGYRRKISLVLQDPLLLDTSVFKNVATGLRFRGVSRKKIKSQVHSWLKQLGIAHLKDRSSRQLSGGEAQRVSLARAFALNPHILLLDEPFRALDAPTRARLLDDFQSLLAETETTVVFVTHDMDEALLLGDRIAVIVDGELRQIGTPEQVFNSPIDVEVAELVGVETVMAGRVVKSEGGQVIVDVCGILVEAVGSARLGQEILLLLRPEDVTLWMGDNLPVSSARNCLVGKVARITPQGPLVRVVVQCQGQNSQQCVQVIALITRTSAKHMGLEINKVISLTFKASAIHLIRRQP